MHEDRGAIFSTTRTGLPVPPHSARWRWASSRRVVVGGGALAAVLSLGSVAAGASTPQGGRKPAGGASHGQTARGSLRPTAAGKVTALSGDDITIANQRTSTETVVYSTTTTFRTSAGPANASNLKVGDFIAVEGTKSGTGHVTAKRITISTSPPGMGGKPGGRPKGAPPSKAGVTTKG